MKSETEHNITDKKSSWRKYTLAAVALLLLIISALVFSLFQQEPKPDPASEKVILETAALVLDKDPNELIDEDFARVKALFIKDTSLLDIMLLEKFTNLQELIIQNVKIAKPAWMKVFTKLGVDMKRFSIDLSPLEKLDNLKRLGIVGTPIKSIEPISKLTNLEYLCIASIEVFNFESLKELINLKVLILSNSNITDLEPIKKLTNLQNIEISSTQVSNLEPLKGMINLENLYLADTPVSNLEPIKELKNLHSLNISGTQVTDLEPLSGLTNLQRLDIERTQVSNLESIRRLKNLQSLIIGDCPNITYNQVEDLQKALPNLDKRR